MTLDVVELTQRLVGIPSASQISNAAVSDEIEAILKAHQFEVERLSFVDDSGMEKVSLVAKKGSGTGGIGFFSHSDTVPGAEDAWNPYAGEVRDGKLYGRGSCDMKGPLAASIVAACEADASELKKPVFVVATADEEIGFHGAYQVAAESKLLNEGGWPEVGVIPEPTRMIPVYAHKGGYHVTVTAVGESAHTSTDKGISANFLIAPFLAEMAALAPRFKQDESFMNNEFDPPTNGFNMTLNDGGTPPNVTAAKTTCIVNFRAMPNARQEDVIRMIEEKAHQYQLETGVNGFDAFYTQPDSDIVKLSIEATNGRAAETVPFGTEAFIFEGKMAQVVLGPGDIAQAHTVGEFVEVAQLEEAVDVYRRMIEKVCLKG